MSETSISKLELETFAKEIGVTPAQLDRWTKRGILPRPTRKGRGRGAGVSSMYPATARTTLRAIQVALTTGRNLDAATLRLWLGGFAVQSKAIRTALLALTRPLLIQNKARNKQQAAGKLLADTLNDKVGLPTFVRTVPEVLQPELIFSSYLLALGGAVDDYEIKLMINAGAPDAETKFPEAFDSLAVTLRQGIESRVFRHDFILDAMKQASDGDLELARSYLLHIVRTDLVQLGVWPIPESGSEVLTCKMNPKFIAFLAAFALHLVRTNHHI